MQGYFSGTLVSLTNLTPTIDSTTLVETIGTTCYSFSYCDKFL
jgi:hypothetical protein